MDIKTAFKIGAMTQDDFNDLWQVFGMRISENTQIRFTHFPFYILPNRDEVLIHEYWIPINRGYVYCNYQDGVAYMKAN